MIKLELISALPPNTRIVPGRVYAFTLEEQEFVGRLWKYYEHTDMLQFSDRVHPLHSKNVRWPNDRTFPRSELERFRCVELEPEPSDDLWLMKLIDPEGEYY